MFRQLIDRVGDRLGRRSGVEAAVETAAASTPPPTTPVATNVPAATLAWSGIGARRPLLSPRGEVAGFEFRIADLLMQRAEPPAQTAHTVALLTAMQVTARSGRVSLAELPAAWLLKPQVAPLLAPGMLIGLRNEGEVDPRLRAHAMDVLHAGGVRVGWHAAPDAPLDGHGPLPDFVLLRPHGATPVASLLRASQGASAGHPELALVVTDLPSLDDLELALRQGVHYACGSVSNAAEPAQATPISPTVQRVCQLLNRLVRDEDIGAIATEIKHDVGLSVQLLRHVSSVRYNRGRPVDSVEAAVMRIGRDELYRWLSLVLVRSAGGRPTSRALQDVAVARARLLELLATVRHERHPSGFFTLGLVSMLPALLKTSAAVALSPLDLGSDARAALLEGTGPWRDYLHLAAAIERHDLQAAALWADDFGGLAGVLDCAEQAWAWVAEHDAG